MGEVIRIPENVPTVPEFRRPPGLPETCTDAELLEAVKAHLCGADDKALAKMLRVPAYSVKYWTGSKEWGQIVKFHLPEVDSILKGQFTRIASLALTQVEDRIVHGDPVYSLDGEYIGTRKLKGKELATIACNVMEQRKALEAVIGKFIDDQSLISLEKLAQGLKNYAEGKVVGGERLE